ncbi:MAG: MFS transporter [Gemmataceae bacterium]|nr:MFS transporter [Gemmataceae bacterium]MCI0739582.1 MFS transporter [Gemmataceae bacterium]
MAFQPAAKLTNRTFVGLIVAQFLAGFNDQALHAAGMFYAIHQGILTEAQAISLMPILFYAPWAIFCTAAGHLADHYSKTYTLIFWKIAEIVIALIALAGFYLGTGQGMAVGAWIVLSTVFLMGTHAAFFAPAKYGAMPEILQPHVLSRGNGILESTTFLAAILGTVAGGMLSFQFRDKEEWIGIILIGLAVFGAVASFLIAYLPAANPTRILPKNIFKPLFENLKVLFTSKPLALSALGIAFFIFMVSYMRATMYMHGQTRNPHWDEFKTSLVVATVALGVALGSPLAGYLSGGKVELGLVPLGCLGMIAATLLAGFEIDHTGMLIAALVIIGFFSGFYMVPLYTNLQHRAPKASKGDLVATSNFINVTGAIAASILFFLLVQASRFVGITPMVPQVDRDAVGSVDSIVRKDKHGPIIELVIDTDEGLNRYYRAKKGSPQPHIDPEDWIEEEVIDFDDDLLEVFSSRLQKGDRVIVSKYTLHGVTHYYLRPEGQPLKPVYNNEGLPRYLFLGAAVMTLVILWLLCRKLPDFFVRTLFWLKSIGTFQLKAVGMQHLPTHGPVLLATNCEGLDDSLQLVSVTDRYTEVVLVEPHVNQNGGLLRKAAMKTSLLLMSGHITPEQWAKAREKALAALNKGDMLAIGVTHPDHDAEIDAFIAQLRAQTGALLIPVFCGPLDPLASKPRVRVVFGDAAPEGATVADLRREINNLADWIRKNDDIAGAVAH